MFVLLQYSTWQDPDFGSYSGPLNTSSLYHLADDGIRVKSDREKMMRHLKTPYVEMPTVSLRDNGKRFNSEIVL